MSIATTRVAKASCVMPNATETRLARPGEFLGERLQKDAKGVDQQRGEADEDTDARRGGNTPSLIAGARLFGCQLTSPVSGPQSSVFGLPSPVLAFFMSA